MQINPAIDAAVKAERGAVHYHVSNAARIEQYARGAIIRNYLEAMEGNDDAKSNEPDERRGD